MLKKTINNISETWEKFKAYLGVYPDNNNVCVIQIKKNKACVIEKDNYSIILGDDIQVIQKNKTINIDENFNITVKGDCILDANTLTIKTIDGALFHPNSNPACLFSGTNHSIVSSIIGKNK